MGSGNGGSDAGTGAGQGGELGSESGGREAYVVSQYGLAEVVESTQASSPGSPAMGDGVGAEEYVKYGVDAIIVDSTVRPVSCP